MNTKTIMTPNFMGKTAKIIAEIRNQTCIDDVDAEVIKAILKDELNEYCRMLCGYYEEEYDIAISSAYDEGYALGYDDGYANGHSDGHSAV